MKKKQKKNQWTNRCTLSKKSEERKGNGDGRKTGSGTNKSRRRRKGIKKKSKEEEDLAKWARSLRCPWIFFF